jgi:hypothetical protein
MVGVVLSLMIGISMGAILVNQFNIVLVAQETSTSTAEFNATIDSIITYTWLTFGFLALGILIVGAAWILRQVGLIGG